MTDISDVYGANTYSYIQLPDFYDAQRDTGINALITTSRSTPIPAPVTHRSAPDSYGVGCSFVPGMDGRNAFRGPGSWGQNLGAVKDFKIHERYDLQLKGEFINIYNHANTFLNLNGTQRRLQLH